MDIEIVCYIKFLFHIGAIKSEVNDFLTFANTISFYSTLVRLKGFVPNNTKRCGNVSIPHWCD